MASRDQSQQNVDLTRSLDRQPIVEIRVDGIKVGEQAIVGLGQGHRQLAQRPLFEKTAQRCQIGRHRWRVQGDPIPFNCQQRRVARRESLQLDERLAETRSGLLLAPIAPQQASQAFAANRLSRMQHEKGKQGAGFATARIDDLARGAVNHAEIAPAFDAKSTAGSRFGPSQRRPIIHCAQFALIIAPELPTMPAKVHNRQAEGRASG